ncbi:MAG: hypothetical protein ACK4Q5_20130 [Saprospiraceae bacterium]
MNIQLEKEIIVRQLMQVQDVELIAAIKSLLNFGLRREQANADELDEEIPAAVQESIAVSLAEFEAGQVIPHETVMFDLKARYGL